jgi:phytoene synthase
MTSADERRLILTYVPASMRDAMVALFALDDTLAQIVRTTTQPMIGQMRMTWWHTALEALDTAAAPAEPVLGALQKHVLPHGVFGADLGHVVEGWEELLEPELEVGGMLRYAEGRGAALFAAMAAVTNSADVTSDAGRGWALADLAEHASDATLRARAEALARPLLDTATKQRWSREGRAMGAMVHLARMGDASPPRRAMRALWHRLSGL